MITAKPLKRKELRSPAGSKANTEKRPSQNHIISISEPCEDHIEPVIIDRSEENKKNYKFTNVLRGKLFEKAILFVVNNTGGIDSWHINKLVEDFARLHKMKYKFSQGNVSGILKQLYDRGLIDREQINGKFYYFKRFSNHDRTELGESIAS